jgi:hypothetical protein
VEKFHTKVFMDSGIEYLFEMSEDEFLKQVVDEEGKLRHSFIRLTTNKQTVSINPLHISSIESIQVNTSQKIGIL